MPGEKFADAAFMSMALHQGILYGPVRSRRLGRSLGINVLPNDVKVCNMNCAYCQYGWTPTRRWDRHGVAWPSPQSIETVVSARLRDAAERGELIDRITVAGHGEPTLHPDFEEIAERLARVRDAVAPAIRLAILSNSTTAGWPDVRRGLARFDEPHMKLDAGDPITYARVNGSGTSIATIVDALRDLPRVIVQAMFVSDPAGQTDNTGEGAVTEWLGAIETIQPSRVQVYTIDRPTASHDLHAAPAYRLREIAERVRSLGIPADVFR